MDQKAHKSSLTLPQTRERPVAVKPACPSYTYIISGVKKKAFGAVSRPSAQAKNSDSFHSALAR